MTPDRRCVFVELEVPGLDHDRNLAQMVSKQARFSASGLKTRRSQRSAYRQDKRNSLSLADDPDVARISAAIESTLAARLGAITRALEVPAFRIGATESSCVCFRNGCFFRSHFDVLRNAAGLRRLSWVYYLNSEPKRFKGGDLLLGDPGTQRAVVEPAHGRIVVFASETVHEVTTVELAPDDFADARFSITGFIADEPTRATRLRFALERLRRRIRRGLRFGGARRTRSLIVRS